jgi:hypothetical protein
MRDQQVDPAKNFKKSPFDKREKYELYPSYKKVEIKVEYSSKVSLMVMNTKT